MGEKLEKIFDIITQKAGFEGRMKFATRTGISRTKASKVRDTDELVRKFLTVAKEVLGRDISDLL